MCISFLSKYVKSLTELRSSPLSLLLNLNVEVLKKASIIHKINGL